ncbi:diaminopimelate decarboxylase family protein [Kitasatospora sp. NPDC059088]|uniref:diaminopimelate decarboxylase family protein n=1 Tax=Kitasatospora sp. NPDC059088 TaxID=3346722 RepID=UPI0036B75C19
MTHPTRSPGHRGDGPNVEDVHLSDLLDEHPTPLVAYSARRLRERVDELRSAFGPRTRIMFSYKACYLPGVLSVLHGAGIDAEVCSGNEYSLALALGLPPERITWNAVALDDSEVALALRNPPGCLGLNTLQDIAKVGHAARGAGRSLDVALRIHPAKISSNYLKRGQRLGFDVTDGSALQAVRQVLDSSRLRLAGFHSHTQVRQATPERLVDSLRSSVLFCAEVQRATGYTAGFVGIGGGLAGHRALEQAGARVKDFAVAFQQVLEEEAFPVQLALEPGRFLVDDAAIGITRVLSRTAAAGSEWWIVDLGTQFLVPFEGREFEVEAAWPTDSPRRTVSIGDRLSSYSGVIKREAQLPEAPPGDLLTVRDVGAYTASTVQRFMYGMPEIVLVDGARTQVQWRPERPEDWVRQVLAAGDFSDWPK